MLQAIVSTWAGEARKPLSTIALLDYWRAAVGEERFETVFATGCRSPLAGLDDLGAQRPTDWAIERLTEYLDWRYVEALPTCLATNCDEAGLAAFLGERIADRVFDQRSNRVRVISLTGPSFRTGREW